MLAVGLTGGIGCGKSTAVDVFRELGVPVIDADRIATELVAKGQPALEQIIALFGQDILLPSGDLNRARLRERVFADKPALEQLEQIIHPGVRKAIEQQLEALRHHVPAPAYVIVDVPLLVEKNYDALFDRIIVVDCTVEQQLDRTVRRDGLDRQSIKSIISTQASREQRLSHASDVLDNTRSRAALVAQIKSLHANLLRTSQQQI